MNQNRSISVLFLSALVVIIIWISIPKTTAQTENKAPKFNYSSGSISNTKPEITGEIKNIIPPDSNVPNEAVFQAITNSITGESAAVALNQEVVTLKDKDNGVIWSKKLTNLVPTDESGKIIWSDNETNKNYSRQQFGRQKIQSIYFLNDRFIVRIGNVYLDIDKPTGNLIGIQSR